jgi:hypothetical protein
VSKIRNEALLRLKNRVARLSRLLELEAPDQILCFESFLVMEAAQMLSPDAWFSRERQRMGQEHKRDMGLCDEDGCEEPVAWIASADQPAPPAGPFHMTSCVKHALETEAQMREEDEEDEYDEDAS